MYKQFHICSSVDFVLLLQWHLFVMLGSDQGHPGGGGQFLPSVGRCNEIVGKIYIIYQLTQNAGRILPLWGPQGFLGRNIREEHAPEPS